MNELPPELDGGEVPFEIAPPRVSPARKLIRHVSRRRKKPPSDLAIALSMLAYFGGALAIYRYDQGLLLSAWLATGPLFVTVYMTFQGRASLLNPYTLFFATILVACVAGHFIAR